MGEPDVSSWLEELGLVFNTDEQSWLTSLREAMIRGARTEESHALVLDPEDELSYPQLVTRLSAHEDTLLADPYVRLAELNRLIAETDVARVLTSSRGPNAGELRGMAALLSGASRKVDVRVSDDASWHDRYVVSPSRVSQLGASINGLNKNVTALLPVQDSAVAGSIRTYMTGLWSAATDLTSMFEQSSNEATEGETEDGD